MDEILDGGILLSLREARILIEKWRRRHDTVRPHGSPRYRRPAPESFIPMDRRPAMRRQFNRTARRGRSRPKEYADADIADVIRNLDATPWKRLGHRNPVEAFGADLGVALET